MFEIGLLDTPRYSWPQPRYLYEGENHEVGCSHSFFGRRRACDRRIHRGDGARRHRREHRHSRSGVRCACARLCASASAARRLSARAGVRCAGYRRRLAWRSVLGRRPVVEQGRLVSSSPRSGPGSRPGARVGSRPGARVGSRRAPRLGALIRRRGTLELACLNGARTGDCARSGRQSGRMTGGAQESCTRQKKNRLRRVPRRFFI